MAGSGLIIEILPPVANTERVARVYVEFLKFLLISVSAATYSITWRGGASFENLEEILVEDLMQAAYLEQQRADTDEFLRRVPPPSRLSLLRERHPIVRATFLVRSSEDDQEDFDVLRFNRFADSYSRHQVTPESLVFARYDVLLGRSGDSFSSTASNPTYYPDSATIGIKFSRDHLLTVGMWEWMIRNSDLYSFIAETVDPRVAVGQLNRIVGKRPPDDVPSKEPKYAL
jgi:hypothetical protein